MAQDDLDIKLKEGKELYEKLLTKYHGGKTDKMYGFFESKIEFIHFYGDNIESRLINYCTFKSDIVINMYTDYLRRKRAKETRKNVDKKEYES